METSKGIAVVAEYKDSVFYQALCDCLNPEHIHTIVLEYDKDLNIIEMNLYARVTYDYWLDKDEWYKFPFNIWRRVKKAVKLIFTGFLEAEGGFMFRGEDHIRDYIRALEEGLVKIKEGEENLIKEISKEESK